MIEINVKILNQKFKENLMEYRQCKHYGNQYHWKEVFSKFGYGDGKVETPHIAQIL